MLRRWEDLPEKMRTEEVRPYYEYLRKKKVSLFLKRLFDIVASFVMMVLLSPIMLVIAIMIKRDSEGSVFFRQERVTQYGRRFRIFKFRTMVSDAESRGSQVTVGNDMRITSVGKKIRKCRLDELPQLINIFLGDMSYVGTRPEVPKYVEKYTSEMMATLLLPAGVTSEASILYKDEDTLLENAENVDEVYVRDVLPGKMNYNLDSMRNFNMFSEMATLLKTVFAVLKKGNGYGI